MMYPPSPQAALKLPPGRPLLQASGWGRNTRGYVGVLTIAWGLGILAGWSLRDQFFFC